MRDDKITQHFESQKMRVSMKDFQEIYLRNLSIYCKFLHEMVCLCDY